MAYKKNESKENNSKAKAQEIFNHRKETENESKGYLKTEFVIDSDKNIILTIFEFEKSDTPLANIILCDCFVIKPRIVTTNDGKKFLSYPSYKNKDGEYINTAYCFNKELIEVMNELINIY